MSGESERDLSEMRREIEWLFERQRLHQAEGALRTLEHFLESSRQLFGNSSYGGALTHEDDILAEAVETLKEIVYRLRLRRH